MTNITCLVFIVSLGILLSASASMAIETSGMAPRSDILFHQDGMKTRTVCTDEEGTIPLFDEEDGTRPSLDKVIDTLVGGCRGSFLDKVISQRFYQVNFE